MQNEQTHTDKKPTSVEECVDSLLERRQHAEVVGLTGSSSAYVLARYLAKSTETLLVLTANQKQADALASALDFYHGRQGEIVVIPHWEVHPYEPLTPHPEVEATRLSALAGLLQGRVRAAVVSVRALMQKVIPGSVLTNLSGLLVCGDDYERTALIDRLLALGYNPVPLVEDRGTFSIRGDILDIFPASRQAPVRIEFFGDTIERMRPFQAATQRSEQQELEEIELLPAREMILTGDYLETFARRLKERCDDLGLPRTQRESILEEAREGLLSPGRSFLLPLNYPSLDTLFDYLPKARLVVVDPPEVEQEIDAFSAEIAEGERHAANREEAYAPAAELYLTPVEVENALAGGTGRIDLPILPVYRLQEDRELYRLRVDGNGDIRSLFKEGEGLAQFADRMAQWQEESWRILLVCHQRGQAERMADLLRPYGLELFFSGSSKAHSPEPGEIALVRGELQAGFRLPDEKWAVITEEEIFGQRVRRRALTEARAKALLSSLAELKEGDYVVHADHGIALYRGLQHLEMNGIEGDFLQIEYAGGDRLYLPVDRIEKVQKYVGGEGHVPRLDRLGSGSWEKARLRARAAVEELARELLNIYARREMAEAYSFSPPDRTFREFEAAFPYEETPDQLEAITDTLDDMQSGKPMDRLICGDVGFGKTEVAIRAAFKAAMDGKQVAVLVPTTILAQQHLESFRERFKGYPLEVEMVSRFRTPKEQKEILQKTAEGKIDVLIGTHRLLQRDVRFRDLGLMIVDEEQRFGVSHKERLKKLRAEVATLTLTATPIPRTLHMGLMGLRSLSVIDTPPIDRLAVRTYVTRFDDELIREAVLRELRRGGQVFFVHNRVQTIGAMAEFLGKLIPEAKIAVGHGQMGERELEKVMLEFIEGKTNVLVSSTIIENGLDISRANTIIVNRADCFGLAQLYQLRGRVGRSNQRAYAYLLIPGEGSLTREARERLKVLQELTELGAGFRIASHDLELRGAGDLLGDRQAGQIAAIGFELYAELLEETIHELRGQTMEERIDPEIRLGVSAFLPEKYVPDPNQRLVLYKKMASVPDEAQLYAIADELRDRYGEIPPPTSLLFEVMKLRVLMKQLKVEFAEFDGRQLVFGFHAETPVPPDKILQLIEDTSGRYRFTPDYRLSVRMAKTSAEELVAAAKKELQAFL
ncbi:transcription-repair coupling factor [Desulfuromonas sp. AOP6]|uniref:transcription-repair coupling factor n=1 Tax=Desulfuromonas sp. AOP6 TaxID=1566351 RepID=UPI00127FC0F5|nr:transcription-repair coupling factor [Desulfuromonas sp. AOP6]BCA81189.1 transcription-repair-coupling factor [Desulfuromonas sp. AOP6]